MCDGRLSCFLGLFFLHKRPFCEGGSRFRHVRTCQIEQWCPSPRPNLQLFQCSELTVSTSFVESNMWRRPNLRPVQVASGGLRWAIGIGDLEGALRLYWIHGNKLGRWNHVQCSLQTLQSSPWKCLNWTQNKKLKHPPQKLSEHDKSTTPTPIRKKDSSGIWMSLAPGDWISIFCKPTEYKRTMC